MAKEVSRVGRRRDVQFGCYLSAEEAGALAAYAERLQIGRPALGMLLVLRELRCGRLGTLPRASQASTGKMNGVRVTARANMQEVKADFAVRTGSFGLGTDEAVSMLFRAELKERWLEQCLSDCGNRS